MQVHAAWIYIILLGKNPAHNIFLIHHTFAIHNLAIVYPAYDKKTGL